MLRTGFLFWLALASGASSQQAPRDSPRTNPFLHTPKAIEMGRQVYLKHCARCHDPMGKPIVPGEPGAVLPTDLTQPKNWVYGTGDPEMFNTLREGTEEMPGFKDKLHDDDIWRAIHFVRSLWPEEHSSKPQ